MDASSKFKNSLPTKPKQLFQKFKDLDIFYSMFQHPPLFTVADAKLHQANMTGLHVKNLFLRDKKKINFLLVVEQDTELDLKTLHDKINSDRLSFGSEERLWQFLGVRPGAVSPLALINDTSKSVRLLFQDILDTEHNIHFHPLVNDITIGIKLSDLSKFLAFTGHQIEFIEI